MQLFLTECSLDRNPIVYLLYKYYKYIICKYIFWEIWDGLIHINLQSAGFSSKMW